MAERNKPAAAVAVRQNERQECPLSTVHHTGLAATDPVDNLMLKAALEYAAQRLPVFPVRPNKSPYTAHGFKDATTDPVRITRWWTDWPEALIGMPTGLQT